MDLFLSALEASGPIAALRFSRWTYAIVNTSHVLAIALLVGGTIPLSLRLFGLWSGVPRDGVVRILALTSGFGLWLAILSGFLLFATRASEYADHTIFQVKLILVGVGGLSAVFAHTRYGWTLDTAPTGFARRAAIISIVCWVSALVLGRLIAFVEG